MKTLLLICLLGLAGSAHALCPDRPSDTYLYYKLGGGVTSTGHDGHGAVAAGIGVRHRGRLGWEVGLSTLQATEYYSKVVLFKSLALLYATPQRPSSLYGGAGLGVGTRCHRYREADIAGLFAEFVLGYEWLFHVKTRGLLKDEKGCHYRVMGLPLRLFIEVSAHQPAVISREDEGRFSSYSPAIVLEVGIGI